MSASILRTCISACLTTALLLSATAGETRAPTEVDGVWKLREYTENGRFKAEEISQNRRLVAKDGIVEITKDGESSTKKKFVILGDSYPKHIDFIDEQGVKTCGILTVRADMMYVAILSDPEKRKTERPSDFSSEGKIIAVYQRMGAQELKNESLASVTRQLGDNPSLLFVLEADQLERGKPLQKKIDIRRIQASLLMVPIKVPIAIDHRIESVKYTSSDRSVLLPVDVLQGAPGLENDSYVQSVTLLLKPMGKGEATIDVEFGYNSAKATTVRYDFSITD